MINKEKLVNYIIFLSIATFPLYFFESGKPQISHYIMFILICLFFLDCMKNLTKKLSYFALFLFSLNVAVRQVFFYYDIFEIKFLMPIFYIFFNIFLFIGIVELIRNSKNKLKLVQSIKNGLIFSYMIAFVGVLINGVSLKVNPDDIYRSIGTFNNPNQLGYFALCSLGIASILFITNNTSFFAFLFLYILSVFLVILSLSKAAVISILFYIFILFDKKFLKYIFIFLLIFIFLFLLLYLNSNFDIQDLKVYQRFANLESEDDTNLIERGFFVLTNNIDLRLIYGYGEGYTILMGGKEIHSTWGNIFISYGFIGAFTFCIFLFFLIKKLIKFTSLLITFSLLIPIILYGITHNGIRFSIFWFYCALLYSISDLFSSNNENIQ